MQPPAEPPPRSRASALVLLPVGLLLAIAAVQVPVAKWSVLTPWKGGGFGMFSTIDSSSNRIVRVFALGAERERRIELPPALERAAYATGCFPTAGRMRSLARQVAARLSPQSRGVVALRVEVWRPRFHGDSSTLAMELFRSLRYDLPAGPPQAGPPHP